MKKTAIKIIRIIAITIIFVSMFGLFVFIHKCDFNLAVLFAEIFNLNIDTATSLCVWIIIIFVCWVVIIWRLVKR